VNQPQQHALMKLAEELTGVSLLESGTVNPFFLLATTDQAYHIPVDFSNQQQKEFTSVKIAAILQAKSCDHYSFVTRIQFPAKAGDKEVMKQQVLILFAQQDKSSSFNCVADLYDLKLSTELARPQLKHHQRLEDFDGQFSNLFDAPAIPDDLMQSLIENADSYLYQQDS